MSVSLGLPQGRVWADGRLLRTVPDACDSHFAIAFERLARVAEDAIRAAVLDALAREEPRSVLLFTDSAGVGWQGWDWFDPLRQLLAVATTVFAALEQLEQLKIRIGLLAQSALAMAPLAHWSEAYPGIVWRTVDEHGRLYRAPGTTA